MEPIAIIAAAGGIVGGGVALLILLAFIVWLGPAIATGAYAYQKGYSWIAVTVCAILLPWPIVLLVVAAIRDKLGESWQQ
jgi:hypothetical protein